MFAFNAHPEPMTEVCLTKQPSMPIHLSFIMYYVCTPYYNHLETLHKFNLLFIIILIQNAFGLHFKFYWLQLTKKGLSFFKDISEEFTKVAP